VPIENKGLTEPKFYPTTTKVNFMSKTKKMTVAQLATLKRHAFKKGQSGNPGGVAKLPALSQAYQRQLSNINPETERTYAEDIAALICQTAVDGDITSIMVVLGNDSKRLIQKAIVKLANDSGLTEQQATAAISLFMPKELV